MKELIAGLLVVATVANDDAKAFHASIFGDARFDIG